MTQTKTWTRPAAFWLSTFAIRLPGSGVRRLFHKLARAESGLDQGLARSLTNAYRYKELADYEAGMAGTVTAAEAGDAITAAEHFVAEVTRVLTPPSMPAR